MVAKVVAKVKSFYCSSPDPGLPFSRQGSKDTTDVARKDYFRLRPDPGLPTKVVVHEQFPLFRIR
jgi:hypothetical protein